MICIFDDKGVRSELRRRSWNHASRPRVKNLIVAVKITDGFLGNLYGQLP